MAHSGFHSTPITEGRNESRKSVLSGKDEIRGLPKSEEYSARRGSRETASCESVLAGPECMKGVSPKSKRG